MFLPVLEESPFETVYKRLPLKTTFYFFSGISHERENTIYASYTKSSRVKVSATCVFTVSTHRIRNKGT